MQLYNTFTRKKEKFAPLEDNLVRVYACGPTVYSNAHIGNLSTFIAIDFLIRYLRFLGFGVKYIRNITDVGHLIGGSDLGEDKLEKASQKQGIEPLQIAEKYICAFHQDTQKLNLLTPDKEPRASEYIQEQIVAVSDLIQKGYAYETASGIYFDITKDKEYGKLARLNLNEKSNISRIAEIGDKKNPLDFAVWVKAVGKHKDHLQNWDSPWGKGFPGWHLECSVMSQKLLGKQFDIHCGGIDLIPIHHTNEIAQSRALYGKNPANFWMHKEHLLTAGQKMSKSLENFSTLGDLEKQGYAPDVYKFFVLSSHYRSHQDFSTKALEQARVNLKTIRDFLAQCAKQKKSPAQTNIIASFWQDFNSALSDDLNSPQALAVIFAFIKKVQKLNFQTNTQEIIKKFSQIEEIFGIQLIQKAKPKPILSPEIADLIKERESARKNQDFHKADQIRNQLAKRGIIVQDKKTKPKE